MGLTEDLLARLPWDRGLGLLPGLLLTVWREVNVAAASARFFWGFRHCWCIHRSCISLSTPSVYAFSACMVHGA